MNMGKAAILSWIFLCLTFPLNSARGQTVDGGRQREKEVIDYVEIPDGSGFQFERGAANNIHYTYTAPSDFKNSPIRIWFQEEERNDPNRKPDLYVWADEIHWHEPIKSGTAAGRVIVDNSKEYRIVTTYVEYNHKLKQIYIPRQFELTQRRPNDDDNVIVGRGGLVTMDDNGIHSVRIDYLLGSRFTPDRNLTNPFERRDEAGRPKEKAQPEQPVIDIPGADRRRKINPPSL